MTTSHHATATPQRIHFPRGAKGWADLPADPALVARIRTELHGRDLVCVCRLELPCHADVLLAVTAAQAP